MLFHKNLRKIEVYVILLIDNYYKVIIVHHIISLVQLLDNLINYIFYTRRNECYIILASSDIRQKSTILWLDNHEDQLSFGLK